MGRGNEYKMEGEGGRQGKRGRRKRVKEWKGKEEREHVNRNGINVKKGEQAMNDRN